MIIDGNNKGCPYDNECKEDKRIACKVRVSCGILAESLWEMCPHKDKPDKGKRIYLYPSHSYHRSLSSSRRR